MPRDATTQPDLSQMEPVSSVTASVAAPPLQVYPPSPDAFLRSPIPPTQWLQPDNLRQFYQLGNPQNRVAPLGANAQAAINSTAKGVATTIVNNAIAAIPPTTAPTDIESIAINKQTGTSYTLQPSDNDTLVTFDNNAGGVITLPSPNGLATAGSTTGGQVDGSSSQSSFSAGVTLSFAPGAASDLTFVAFGGQSAPFGTPVGWTGLAGASGNVTFISKQQSGAAPITVSATPGSQYWSACLVGFRSSGVTTVTNRGAQSGVLTNGGTIVLAGLTAGNFLIALFANGAGIENGPLNLSLSDSQTNVWKPAASAEQFYTVSGPSTQVSHAKVYSALIKANGANTITLSISAGSGTTVGGNISIFEVTGLVTTGPVSALPAAWFTYLENTGSGTFGVGSLSTIDEISQVVQLQSNTGMLVVYDGTNYYTVRGIQKKFAFTDISGIVALSQGGTGTDLSNSGGPNQFVTQNSTGGVFGAARPDYNNLAGVNKATTYNNLALVGAGLVSVYQLQNRPGSSGNLGLTNLAAIPGGGSFVRFSVYLIVSTAATTSSTLPDSQVTYTDNDSGALITVNATPSNTGNTTSTFQQATYVFFVKGGTIMQFAIGQVTPYASSGVTSMVYSYRCRVELLG